MASHKNELTIEGNLVRDPVLKYTGSGKPVCNFSIATNRFYKQGDGFEKETSFFDVTCWGDAALDVNERCQKGALVEIKGKLKQDRWTDREGKNISKVIIVADGVTKQERQQRQNYQDGQDQQEHQEACPF
jgi:single-strand DNA-binding protein